MKKNIIMKLVKYILLVIGGWIIGTLLIMGVYALPIEKMRDNAQRSLVSFEGPDSQVIAGYKATRMDNYTTVLMINTAVYDSSETLLVQAMKGQRYHKEGQTDYEDGIELLQGEEGTTNLTYERYWNGWLVVLKPLLLFFKYSDIQFICFGVSLLGLILICIEIVYNGLQKYLIPFISGNVVIMPLTVSMCIDYCLVYYIMLSTCYIILRTNRKQTYSIEKENFIFLLSGMMTSYVDFLTYPLVTLGFLLIFCCLISNDDHIVRKLLLKTFLWGVGYLGMWLGKWFLASIVLKENIVKEAILQILFRVSNDVSDIGIIENVNCYDALARNLSVLTEPGIVVINFILIVAVLVRGVKHTNEKVTGKILLSLFLIGCLPFLWITIVVNHSYVHYWMVYRILGISFFAWESVIAGCFRPKKIFLFNKSQS